MDHNRILELAFAELTRRKKEIENEIVTVRAELNGTISGVQKSRDAVAEISARRSRTPAERKAHSERMIKYWAAKKARAARTLPSAGMRRRPKSEAEKKAMSLKMKQIWKRRRAEVARKSAR